MCIDKTLKLRDGVRDDKTIKLRSEGEFCFLGHFGPWRSYLKMGLKNDFFDFFQTVCFWKAETKLEMDLLNFLGSEVI